MCEIRGKRYNLFTKRVTAGSPEDSEWYEQQNLTLTNNLVVREQEIKGLCIMGTSESFVSSAQFLLHGVCGTANSPTTQIA